MRGEIGLYFNAVDWLARVGSGWWAGWSGGGNGAALGTLDWEDGSGAVMAVPNGAKEAGVSGSGWMSMAVGAWRRGGECMIDAY